MIKQLLSIVVCIAGLLLIFLGMSNGGMVSAISFALSLVCLITGYILAVAQKESVSTKSPTAGSHFKILNGVAIAYLGFTGFILITGLLLDVRIEKVVNFVFAPFSFITAAKDIQFAYYGLMLLTTAAYIISGSATKRSMRTSGTVVGIVSVTSWHVLAIVLFAIGGRTH